MTRGQLSRPVAGRICAAMRTSSFSLACLLIGLAGPALAQPHPAAPKSAPGPKKLGTFDDWTAATHQEGGATVCYAFTYPSNSVPKLPGRGEVVLTVTERPTGRDELALTAGFAYAPNATVTLQVDQAGFDFYTAQRNAFARDGKAAIAALQKGNGAQARSPGPRDARVVDTFSLRGFSAAYAAINKACPAR
ncbi:MAG TPA: invasion associated locus B family protein [Acetobacteraceae bacterium]|jgi:invasion protein IalB|nr:invasion associated locus B family protein [Acetobacteraceae bacterium]